MKDAVSISLGSPKRDERIKANLTRQKILFERIDMYRDIAKVRQMYWVASDGITFAGK
jgi:hypothetical protein